MKKTLFALSTIGLLALASCSKNNSAGTDNSNTTGSPKVQLVLTDAAGPYDAVNINVKAVKINMGGEGSDSNWVNYPLNALFGSKINLLDLRNGRTVYMGDPVTLPVGTISQIRLILGDGNTVVVGGVTHDLKTPSAQESGLKIQVNQTLQANGIYKIWLDFDANRSIVQAGNSGQFLLKPVIKASLETADFGAIRGIVLPSAAHSTVYLLKGADTVSSALPELAGSAFGEGYYKFVNLAAGTYSLSFDAVDSTKYKDSTVNNISVTTGNITNVNTVTLHQ